MGLEHVYLLCLVRILVLVGGVAGTDGAAEDESADEEGDETGDGGDRPHGPVLEGAVLAGYDDIVTNDDLADGLGLDFLERRFEVGGQDLVGGASLGEAGRHLELGEVFPPVPRSETTYRAPGASRRHDRRVVVFGVTSLGPRRLVAAVVVVLPEVTADLGRVAIDRVLDDEVEVKFGRRVVVTLDLHGDGQLGRLALRIGRVLGTAYYDLLGRDVV